MDILQEPIFEMKFINVEYVFYKIYLFLYKTFGGNVSSERSSNIDSSNVDISSTSSGANTGMLGDVIRTIFFILILFLLTLIIYTIVRMFEIRKKEHEYIHNEIHEYANKQKLKQEKINNISGNTKWLNVIDLMNSKSASDWKLAIIEADSILDSLVSNLGFEGATLGDRLKNADKDKYKSLNSVWEAHNVRNRIAHEGASFEISHNEAKRVIGIYEQVFRDYRYI